MSRPTKGVTISDVAARAGVSLSTVSRVLNDNPTVDPVMADRVRAAAAELNYSANPLARSLVLGRTQTVAVVVPDLGNPTFQGILRGLSRAAAADGYHVLIADSAETVGEESVLAVATRRRTDGIILCAPRMPLDELRALLPQISPVVLVNRAPEAGTPVVAADYAAALREILDHLHAYGHRRYLYLAGTTRSASNAARLRAIAEFGAAHPDVTVDEREAGVDFESGERAAAGLGSTDATAILGFNDLVAMGAMSTLRAAGVRVPEDVSITGFDDIPFARHATPALTTASVPTGELGARAWAAMAALLATGDVAEPLFLRPRLQVRASTGPAR
ncbi:LacI family DNA-binding transcriptional regulator [Microbacterium sp. P02]|uniref:LacI family DNA-binding transcriptional regulator n=1 Tax=Microbacterium sp. P02 TaxID=3366260 RepID=UPI00366DD357